MKIIAVTVVILMLVSGCTKNESTVVLRPVTNCLLKTATYTTIPATYSSVDEYSYDSYNRVTELNSTRLRLDIKYTYDANNNLLTATIYDLSNNNRLISTDKFTNSGNVITATGYDSDGIIFNTYTMTLNDSRQQVVSLSSYGDNELFNYDDSGNLKSYTSCCSISQSDTYSYDDKKHPLSMIGVKNFHLMLLTNGEPESYVNNILTDAAAPGTVTYTYNSDGFPVSSSLPSASVKGLQYVITYSYLYN